jgi:mannose-1-phosphate guanylyltransferase
MIREALVLTAGLGTRLRPLTDVRAKPAIPVAGQPMIHRIVRALVAQGVSDLVLNLHHLPATLTAVVGDGSDLGARVRYSWEPAILGSGGGPRLAQPIVGARTFWIINGDTLSDVDLTALAAEHAASHARVTLALVPNREFMRYGGVRLDAHHHVVGFVKRGPAAEGTYHYIGVQLVDGAVFDVVAPCDVASSIGGVYDALIASDPRAVCGFVSDAAFFDVGRIADYWRTHEFLSARAGASPAVGRRVVVEPTARITRSILWDDVRVAANATIEECILTDGVAIPAGAAYRRAVLLKGPHDTLLESPLNLEPEPEREPRTLNPEPGRPL